MFVERALPLMYIIVSIWLGFEQTYGVHESIRKYLYIIYVKFKYIDYLKPIT